MSPLRSFPIKIGTGGDTAILTCAMSLPAINRDRSRHKCEDKSLAALNILFDPDILATEIVENLEAGLESFKAVVRELGK